MSFRGLLRSAVLLTGAALLFSGCQGAEPAAAEDVIERETFIATYVDLRRAALDAPEGRIDQPRMLAVLEVHGVTEEDLLEFAEVHGRDVAYMASVWAEVEKQLEPGSAPADTTP